MPPTPPNTGRSGKLKIRRIYDLIPSNMENKKKRVVAQHIEHKKGKTFGDYQDEFEYLISAGIALNVQAISNPRFPLAESQGKNLLKLYLNDVGLLSGILYGHNIQAILEDVRSINLSSVYETVVASELIAHGYTLFYYDNRSKGEVDFLIDDYEGLSVVPIEVKSGKDYMVHSALNTFVSQDEYHIQNAFCSVQSARNHPERENHLSSHLFYHVLPEWDRLLRTGADSIAGPGRGIKKRRKLTLAAKNWSG